MLKQLPLVALFAFVSPAFAGNLVLNPGFDNDLDHWVSASALWIAEDEFEDPASGSAYIELGPHSGRSLNSNCFPLAGGERLVFGATANLAGSDPHAARVAAAIRYFALPGCAGAQERTPYPQLIADSVHTGWGPTQATSVAPEAAQSARLELVLNSDGDNSQVFRIDNAYVIDGSSCATTSTVLCLENDRFRATAQWTVPDGTRGYAGVVPLSVDSGYLWFFDSSNLELVLKVLDGCGFNQRYWVFSAGLTNLGVRLTVHDTLAGESWVYENPLNAAFPPQQDIEAFANCPGS